MKFAHTWRAYFAAHRRWLEGDHVGARVELRFREPINSALRRFKKLCEKEGLHADLKRANAGFETPTQRRRRKAHKAEQQRKKEERQQAARTKRRR